LVKDLDEAEPKESRPSESQTEGNDENHENDYSDENQYFVNDENNNPDSIEINANENDQTDSIDELDLLEEEHEDDILSDDNDWNVEESNYNWYRTDIEQRSFCYTASGDIGDQDIRLKFPDLLQSLHSVGGRPGHLAVKCRPADTSPESLAYDRFVIHNQYPVHFPSPLPHPGQPVQIRLLLSQSF
jgi:hypothetical protein